MSEEDTLGLLPKASYLASIPLCLAASILFYKLDSIPGSVYYLTWLLSTYFYGLYPSPLDAVEAPDDE